MKPYGIIYKITNKINGHAYCGKSKPGLKKRWKDHKYLANMIDDNNYFHNAIKLYGSDNFTLETLCECDTPEILNIMETFKIIIHKTHVTEGGYNLTWGGDGSYGYKHSEESKKKMSLSKLGKYEGNKNPNYGKTGIDSIWFGKKHSPETKQKMSKNMQGIKRSIEGCENIRKSQIGKTLSDETRKKLRIIQSGEGNGNSKTYKIIFPSNETKTIKCLKSYCLLNNLNYGKVKYHIKTKGKYNEISFIEQQRDQE